MTVVERPVEFGCEDGRLFGIIHKPEPPSDKGVLVVVGGPQYRVGSHRQFVLLGRALAAAGIYTLRFDYRGMGDSSGEPRTFDAIDADIRSAIDVFVEETEGLEQIVIWGLCDAASAALFYAYQDPRVTGLVLLNPWVRTEDGIARAYLKHYYTSRLLSSDLWNKVLRGEFKPGESLASLLGMLKSALGKVRTVNENRLVDGAVRVRMAYGMRQFGGRVLIILSGDDLTASEFKDMIGSSRQWRRLLKDKRVEMREIAAANHTFARREWRDQVSGWTIDWIRSW